MVGPSIRDVASLAGVAASTVSVVLNEVEGARVSSATRTRVREAAELLGYAGNDHARILRRGAGVRTSVALVTDLIATGPYGGALIEGAQAAAWRHGAVLTVLNTGGQPAHEHQALRVARQGHPTGIIVASLSYAARAVPEVPGLVLANAAPAADAKLVPHVVPDEVGAGEAIGEELIALGHKEVGVATIRSALAAQTRMRGLRRALRRRGVALDPSRIHRVSRFDATAEGGYQATRTLLHDHPEITAIWCFNDRMAMGAYRAAAEVGREIPETLTIIGFDNLEPIAESLWPSLTTMALPYYEIGEHAVDIALDPDHRVRASRSMRMRLPCTMIRRFSAGPAVVPARLARSP